MGKRKLMLFYQSPTHEQDTECFPVVITIRGLIIELAHNLTSGRVHYKTDKHSFILIAFAYQEGITGYELVLRAKNAQPEAPYMSKPGGRKLKAKQVSTSCCFPSYLFVK